MKILEVDFSRNLDLAASLVREYRAALSSYFHPEDYEALMWQRADELQELPRRFGPPGGSFMIAAVDEKSAGCVALQRLQEKICEMNRFFVRPEFRGQGVGKKLIEAVLEKALEIGYEKMRLSTATTMTQAISLYRSFGFEEIEAYKSVLYRNPVFMERIVSA